MDLLCLLALVLTSFVARAVCESSTFDLGYQEGIADLTNFVTRPEIRMPRFNITYRAQQGVTPGYWFVAPYAVVQQEQQPANYYQACSTGPAIYDGNGELVWTGACQLRNQNACDFRLFHGSDGQQMLSLIAWGYEEGLDGTALVLDNSYQLQNTIHTPNTERKMNMHEFNPINEGRSALYLTYRSVFSDVSGLQLSNTTTGWLSEFGFREIDIESAKTTFEWWTTDHVSYLETTASPVNFNELRGPGPVVGWNWFHPNSVDKSANGDYLLSGRFVDTVYKISPTGQILWRLGGKHSSFVLDGFNFSKQHDARFISLEGDIETISLFDNAKAQHPGLSVEESSRYSSALVIALNHTNMTAKVVHRIVRPDERHTELRGNHQILPNGHSFVSWADNGYVSEHDPNGELLLEAKFRSERFVTYRAYKFNFTGKPLEPPVLRVQVYGETPETSTTAWYSSWNGATEVVEWRYYGAHNSTDFSLVGAAPKVGFETVFVSDTVHATVYAEAVDQNGAVLGRTGLETVRMAATRTEASKDTFEYPHPQKVIKYWEDKSEL